MKGSWKQSKVKKMHSLSICFAGDSGDGIQSMGQNMSASAALCHNDVRTIADFPAEIRAPAGTLAGVSRFTLSLSDECIFTPAESCDVLVAMNPAALKMSLTQVKVGGLILINQDNFTERDFSKAEYPSNPLEDGSLQNFQVVILPLTTLTLQATAVCQLSHSQAKRCKNFYTLGCLIWLYDRDLAVVEKWIAQKWHTDPETQLGIQTALLAGFTYAENTELTVAQQTLDAAPLAVGDYRLITGNEAIIYALLAARLLSDRDVFVSGYPITPASSILQGASQYRAQGLMCFQAEDEIAAINACIGAAFGGAIAVTCTSGPGLDLKTEGLGLALMTRLPLVIINVQRAGPSTGMPTKTEQSDLLACVHGRHGESPLPVLAPASPSDCFKVVLAAVKLAIDQSTPVIVLSDATLAGSSEPWRLPDMTTLSSWPNATHWHAPGIAGGEHLKGGLETDLHTHQVSCDANNHAAMTAARAANCAQALAEDAEFEMLGDSEADVCVVAWGSTYGVVRTAVATLAPPIAYCHLRQLWPLAPSLLEKLINYRALTVVELNTGQLASLLRAALAELAARTKRSAPPILQINQITGQPLSVAKCQSALQIFVEQWRESCDVN